MLKTCKYISPLAAIICWMSAIYTFWQAYSKHDLLSLTPVIAYNGPQGIFGWSISLAFILTVVSFVLMIIGKSK